VELTTNQKGLLAEHAVIQRAIMLGVGVARPLDDERYDLILDFRPMLVRVQCKWAVRERDAVVVRCYTARRGPDGIVVKRYSASEVDALAAYCAEIDRCFLLPIDRFGDRRHVYLRLGPSKNNQQRRINLADRYEFGATLPERLRGP
jgi:hypothetical protein